MSIDYNKNLTTEDMLDVICYNLAQFSFLNGRYAPALSITNYDAFLNLITSHIQQNAQERVEKIKKLNTLKNKYKHKEKLYDAMIWHERDLPYDIYKVASNKSYAKFIAKSVTMLGDFEVVVADQKTQARFFDSVGKTNLLGPDNDIFKTHLTHYQEIHSIGPLQNTHTPKALANQNSVEGLISMIVPPKAVHHQIWINDHLMIKANFSTNKSLSKYLNENPHKIKELLHVISYAEEIDAKAGGKPSQQFVDEEMKKSRIEFTKQEAEKHLEQYSLLASELFAQLIKKFKRTVPGVSLAKTFNDLDKIPGKKREFTQSEIDTMKIYQNIRDSLAHPTKYNLRPLGNSSQSNLQQNFLSNFVEDMAEYLSVLFNKDKSEIKNKINSNKQEEIFDVRPLISLMDTRKAFRDICVKRENMPDGEEGVFKKLDIITEDEDDILKAALDCRNELCHGKIDWDLAKKAEEIAMQSAPIIDKIATAINKKYGTSIQESFNKSYKPKSMSVKNLKSKYPFLTNSFETDPNKKMFEDAFKQKQALSKTPLDKKLLLELYTFAMTLHTDLIVHKNIQKTSFVQEEVNPFINEIGYEIQTKEKGTPFKHLVAKGVINAWLNGHKIPERN